MNTVLAGDRGQDGEPRAFREDDLPPEVRERLLRRDMVTRELLRLEITESVNRVAAIPRLCELLAIYPHPLAYETLIHAYLDAGRFDEAKGVAFVARQRRLECAASHPAIQAEIESLHEWSVDEIDALRLERMPG